MTKWKYYLTAGHLILIIIYSREILYSDPYNIPLDFLRYFDNIQNKETHTRGGIFLESLFKALADPTRRRILELLKNGSMTAGDIADAFDIGKPSISHHLNILKAADLVQSERDGQNIVYTLNTSVFQELVAWVYGLKKEDKPE
jgi:ArsR family transcriptional regulator